MDTTHDVPYSRAGWWWVVVVVVVYSYIGDDDIAMHARTHARTHPTGRQKCVPGMHRQVDTCGDDTRRHTTPVNDRPTCRDVRTRCGAKRGHARGVEKYAKGYINEGHTRVGTRRARGCVNGRTPRPARTRGVRDTFVWGRCFSFRSRSLSLSLASQLASSRVSCGVCGVCSCVQRSRLSGRRAHEPRRRVVWSFA